MKTTLSEREGNTVKVVVEVSSEELQEAFNKNLRELAREARIPGFRPGKAPTSMVRQRMGDEAILVNSVEESLSDWFKTAVTELELTPLERPEIELGEDELALDKPVMFTATVTVMPEVELGQYKGVEAPRETAVVEDEEVDAQMERLRSEFAELRPVTDRKVEKGDFVTVDFHSSLDGEPVEELDAGDFVFEVGGGRIFPEIDEQIVGMEPGEERTFPLALPEDAGPEELQGKTVDFTVMLKEIKEKVLPSPTDQWASEVSEFATLLELRLDIRDKLQAGRTYAADQRYRAQAIKAAVDNVTIDLPDVLVREQAEEMLIDFQHSMEAQGASLQAYLDATGATPEQMIDDLKVQAAVNVKTGLVLDAIAKAEGVEATDEEVAAAIAEMAAATRMDAKAVEDRLRKNGRIEPLKWQIVRDKAADLIFENAVPVELAAAAAEDAAPAPEDAPAETASAEDSASGEPAEAAPAEAAPADAPEAAPAEDA